MNQPGDIKYQPGQQVPEGEYIVILRRVDRARGNSSSSSGTSAVVGPPAEVPPVNPAEVPPMNQREEGNSNLGGGGKKGKKGKKAKGTRKLSPYMKFAQEARKNILAEDPSLKSNIIAVGKRIGEKWRALSDAEKARY